MGNCLRSHRVMAQDPDQLNNSPVTESKKVEADRDHKPPGGSAMAKPKTAEDQRSGAKKVVRFKLQEEEINYSSGGGGGGGGETEIGDTGAGISGGVLIRIKLVVSQKELKQILKDRENNSCSVEELIAELKVKGRTSSISDAIDLRSALKTVPDQDLQ